MGWEIARLARDKDESIRCQEFEKAAMLRDQVIELRGIMALKRSEDSAEPLIFEN